MGRITKLKGYVTILSIALILSFGVNLFMHTMVLRLLDTTISVDQQTLKQAYEGKFKVDATCSSYTVVLTK